MTEIITELPRLKPRSREGHKGLYGRLLIIGGSEGMAGAPALAARAAFRCGAGLVKMAVPQTIWQNCCLLEPCATCLPLATGKTGRIDPSAAALLQQTLARQDGAAIGPGLGNGPEMNGLLESLLTGWQCRLVIDADGLNILAALRGQKLHANTILTPHPGEMQRLWQAYFRQPMPDDRVSAAVELSQATQAVVALKGANTVITDGKMVYINTTGCPGMATGGSGDVLTGCITALLACQENRLTPFQAAQLGVYIHGLAGELAARQLTEIAMTAADIINFLPEAWKTAGYSQ